MSQNPVLKKEFQKRDVERIRNLVKGKYGSKTRDPCLLYTSPSPRDRQKSRMPSSA